MNASKGLKILFGILLAGILIQAQADNILIINGASGTSEPGTTADITSNLDSLLQSQGNSTTISDPVPVNLAGFDQIWDIRFSNSLPISAGEESQFLAFLQAGGNMFVMGENAGFATRNNSVISLVAAAGGGSLTFASPASTQNVSASLQNPNTIATVSYDLPGGAAGGGTTAGTGEFLSSDGAIGGTAIGFAAGTLTNAPAGALAVAFDVNFMQAAGTGNTGLFLENLTQYVETGGDAPATPPVTPIPALSEWGLIVLMLSMLVVGFYATRSPLV